MRSKRNNQPSDSQSSKKSKKNLLPVSCLECRRRKIKCDRDLICKSCTKKGLKCEYPETFRSVKIDLNHDEKLCRPIEDESAKKLTKKLKPEIKIHSQRPDYEKENDGDYKEQEENVNDDTDDICGNEESAINKHNYNYITNPVIITDNLLRFSINKSNLIQLPQLLGNKQKNKRLIKLLVIKFFNQDINYVVSELLLNKDDILNGLNSNLNEESNYLNSVEFVMLLNAILLNLLNSNSPSILDKFSKLNIQISKLKPSLLNVYKNLKKITLHSNGLFKLQSLCLMLNSSYGTADEDFTNSLEIELFSNYSSSKNSEMNHIFNGTNLNYHLKCLVNSKKPILSPSSTNELLLIIKKTIDNKLSFNQNDSQLTDKIDSKVEYFKDCLNTLFEFRKLDSNLSKENFNRLNLLVINRLSLLIILNYCQLKLRSMNLNTLNCSFTKNLLAVSNYLIQLKNFCSKSFSKQFSLITNDLLVVFNSALFVNKLTLPSVELILKKLKALFDDEKESNDLLKIVSEKAKLVTSNGDLINFAGEVNFYELLNNPDSNSHDLESTKTNTLETDNIIGGLEFVSKDLLLSFSLPAKFEDLKDSSLLFGSNNNDNESLDDLEEDLGDLDDDNDSDSGLESPNSLKNYDNDQDPLVDPSNLINPVSLSSTSYNDLYELASPSTTTSSLSSSISMTNSAQHQQQSALSNSLSTSSTATSLLSTNLLDFTNNFDKAFNDTGDYLSTQGIEMGTPQPIVNTPTLLTSSINTGGVVPTAGGVNLNNNSNTCNGNQNSSSTVNNNSSFVAAGTGIGNLNYVTSDFKLYGVGVSAFTDDMFSSEQNAL